MKLLLPALFLLSSSFTHASYRRLEVPSNYNCQDIQNLVRQEGAVLVYQNPHLYDRFVVNGSYCLLSHRTKPGYVKARNTDYCLAGYLCRRFNP